MDLPEIPDEVKLVVSDVTAIAKSDKRDSPSKVKMKKEISSTLADFDSDMVKADPNHKSVQKLFDEVISEQDTNESIRDNLHQIIVLFHTTWSDFLKNQSEMKVEIAELKNNLDDPNARAKFEVVYGAYSKEKNQDLKTLVNLSQTVGRLADIWNKSKLAERNYHHTNQVMEMKFLVLAAIQKYVNNPAVVSKMADFINNGCRKIFGK